MKYLIYIASFVSLTFTSACKKLIEIDGPKTSLSTLDIYSSDATAIGTITSLYANMASGLLNATSEFTSLSCIAGLSADELTLFSRANNFTLSSFYQNNLTNNNLGYWKDTYSRLYLVNAAIEGLTSSEGLTPAVKQHLLGEAKFMRAFYYFYLVNLYGDVPLVISTEYTSNDLIPKSSRLQIYDQIIIDLRYAEGLLSDQYLKADAVTAYPIGAEERVRPTKAAAMALMSRTFLFRGEWSNAERQATLVIDNKVNYKLESLDRVFLKNNMEAIWQLQPINRGVNTRDAGLFLLPVSGPSASYPVYISESLIDAFELSDQRRNAWLRSITANGVVYFYPYKYKVPQTNVTNTPITEYSTVMRLAEQYLIRAEARAHQGNISGAISDLDEIRKRAGLSLVGQINPDINQMDLLELILKEKQLEFFTEWGHRWLDIKRTNRIDALMTVITPKKGNLNGWKSYQQYYPIHIRELNTNPNLTPTPGY